MNYYDFVVFMSTVIPLIALACTAIIVCIIKLIRGVFDEKK